MWMTNSSELPLDSVSTEIDAPLLVDNVSEITGASKSTPRSSVFSCGVAIIKLKSAPNVCVRKNGIEPMPGERTYLHCMYVYRVYVERGREKKTPHFHGTHKICEAHG